MPDSVKVPGTPPVTAPTESTPVASGPVEPSPGQYDLLINITLSHNLLYKYIRFIVILYNFHHIQIDSKLYILAQH